MSTQISIFGGTEQFALTKPIRLIELFAGIGSQAKALTNIGANFEHWRVCEFDKYAVTSYNAIHDTNFEPSDITKLTASDLGIVDTDKYDYIMTYSFPCTDLSNAGKRLGMARDSGTRSGLLWEVERLLTECTELPQVLLMENVTEVHGTKNKQEFALWVSFLEQLGYKCYWQDINATEHNVAQNRDRCFMVSILGDCYYPTIKGAPLTKTLADYLEDDVDEKYYITDAQIESTRKSTYLQTQRKIQQKAICDTLCARDYKDPKCVMVGMLSGGKWDKLHDISRRVYDPSGISPTVHTSGGGQQELKVAIMDDTYPSREPRFYEKHSPSLRATRIFNVVDGARVRKLTPKEYWRLMGFDDADFDKAKKALNDTYYKGKDRSNSQLYKMAGNSIVVDVLMAIFKEMKGEQ